jgi:hypothetical protein
MSSDPTPYERGQRTPYIPLRWYELLLLRFLSHSPRIHRILVQQVIYDDAPEDGLVQQLEALYHGPTAER